MANAALAPPDEPPGVRAQEAVFVDDQARNIEGALRCGLQVVHFDVRAPAASYDKALRLLEV